MLLTLTTTHRPATDLGFLLAKHPARLQSTPLGMGEAHVFYLEATEERCTAALLLDLDPVALVRGRPGGGRDAEAGPLASYVNDRPYVASSFMSVAIAKAFGSALNGRCNARPELALTDLPLSAQFGPVRSRGGLAVIERLFTPLGYTTAVKPVPPRHWTVTLSGTTTLQRLLSHLYVLIPVLDADKHYWIGPDEIEKLLRHGEGWLAGRPEREMIAQRYLARGARLARAALERLAELDETSIDSEDAEPPPDPAPNLNEQRYIAVQAALEVSGATSVLDLGCGEGKLLRRLARDRRYTRLVGADASIVALGIARDRIYPDRRPEDGRITLLHAMLTYRDRRLAGFDAAAVVEVVEHIEPARLPAFERALFGEARPGTIVLTTPNRDWNATVPTLAGGALRHSDHRFEWTRPEFAAWSDQVASTHGYTVERSGVGEPHPAHGPPTQMAVFRCR